MQTMGFIQSSTNTDSSSSILVPQTFTHSIAFGQTGSGKTTFMIIKVKNISVLNILLKRQDV